MFETTLPLPTRKLFANLEARQKLKKKKQRKKKPWLIKIFTDLMQNFLTFHKPRKNVFSWLWQPCNWFNCAQLNSPINLFTYEVNRFHDQVLSRLLSAKIITRHPSPLWGSTIIDEHEITWNYCPLLYA